VGIESSGVPPLSSITLPVIDDEVVKTVNEEEGDENEYRRNGTPQVMAAMADLPSWVMECYRSKCTGETAVVDGAVATTLLLPPLLPSLLPLPLLSVTTTIMFAIHRMLDKDGRSG